MIRINRMMLILGVATILAACDDGGLQTGSDSSNGSGSGTGGSTTTDQGVEIALGVGSGSSFSAGGLTIASTTIAAGGQTSVSVNVVDTNSSNALYSGVPVTIQFTSACAEAGKAVFSNASVIPSNGVATTTYQAEGCVGSDVVTASVNEAVASGTVTVSPADVGSISYQGADVTSIAYDEFWGVDQPSIAKLSFILFDNRGNPVPGQEVTFSLTTEDGGISLSNATAESNDAGIVTTRVNAGSIATSVRVIATFTATDGTQISTVSYPIAVNSGPADQDSFSLSASSFAPEAWNYNGTTVDFSIHAADHHNNPVPDGTEISFWAEYGYIQDTCTTTGGGCSVTWTSGGDRQATPDPVNLAVDGLVTIVAFTAGEDSFYENGQANQLFDDTDGFTSTPERFYDRNFNGSYDAAFEEYYDYDESGSYTASSTSFRGYSCSDSARALGHCANAVEVWDHSQILMAGSHITLTPTPGSASGETLFSILLEDVNGNQPPADSSISVETSYGTATIIGPDTVPDGTSTTGFTVTILFEPDDEAGAGNMIVEIQTPNGVKSGINISVSN